MTDIVIDSDLKDIIKSFETYEVVEKGSSTSGNFGHAGRPGKIGGSTTSKLGPGSDYYRKTHSGNDYGPFGENELLYENAYYTLFGRQHADEPFNSIGMVKKYDMLVKGVMSGEDYSPNQEGLIYVGEDPVNTRFFESLDYGSADWKKAYQDDRGDIRYINTEQLQYLMDKMGKAAFEREQFLMDSINMPGTYKELFGDIDVLNTNTYEVKFGTEDYKKYEAAASKMLENLKQADMTEYGSGEIEYTLFDRYEKEVAAEFGADSEQAKNVNSWLYRMGNEASDYHEFEVLKSVSAGDITPEKGDMLGVNASKPRGDSPMEYLPNELWHAATDAESIQTNGIKSRRELGGRVSEVGLGGGEDNTISFTSDPKIGADIERSLHEAHMVASGKLTVKRMIEVARDGAGGVGRNWAADMVVMKDPKFFENHPEIDKAHYDPFKDGMPYVFQELIDMEEGKIVPKKWGTYEGLTGEAATDYIRDQAFEFFKYNYSIPRQYSGGFMDPLFFGTNWKQLAKRDSKNFKALKYKPSTTRSRGYQVSALGEWRVYGGDAVELVEVIDNYDADDTNRILGYTQ